jgi:hypothetical protein
VLAAAQQIADKRSEPVTGTVLAERASVNQSVISRLHDEIQRRFPGVLVS